jgi:hypothetical protein
VHADLHRRLFSIAGKAPLANEEAHAEAKTEGVHGELSY